MYNRTMILDDSYNKTIQEAQLPQNKHTLAVTATFKVTDFGTNQKPVCNFRLVNNNNLHRILYHFQVTAQYWSNFHFLQRVPLFNALVGGGSLNSRV